MRDQMATVSEHYKSIASRR